MATLQELESQYTQIKDRVKDLQRTIKSNGAELKKVEKELAPVTTAREKAELDMNYFASSKKYAKNATEEKQYEKKYEEAKRIFEEKSKEEQELLAKKAILEAPTNAEELKNLQEEMNGILKTFASDSRINQHLQENVKYQYGKKIEAKDAELEKTVKTAEALKLALKDENVFGKEVDALVETFRKMSKLDPNSPDPDEIAARHEAAVKYSEAALALKTAITNRPEFADVTIGKEDLTAIITVATTIGLNYELPSMQVNKEDMLKQKSSLEGQRDRTLLLLERAKERVAPGTTPELTEITDKIMAKENEITAKNAEVSAAEQEVNKISEKQNKVKRLEELRNKGGIPNSKSEINYLLKELKDRGYISEDTIPELADEESNISKKYSEFVNADKAVREAFAKCRSEVSDDTKKELEEKVAEFQKVSTELNSLSGMKTEDWNKYLLRQLAEKSKNGEEIDEVYFEENAKKGYKNLKSEFSEINEDVELEEKYDKVGEKISSMSIDEEMILTGKAFDMAEVLKDIDDYALSMSALATGLDVEKDSLFSKMAGDIAEGTKGFFSRITQSNFFKRITQGAKKIFNLPGKFDPYIEYDEEIDELNKKLKEAQREDDYEDLIEENKILSDDEKDELRHLDVEVGDITSIALIDEKVQAERKLQKAKNEIVVLEAEKSDLELQKQDIEKNSKGKTIDDAQFIAAGNDGKKLTKAVLDEPDVLEL